MALIVVNADGRAEDYFLGKSFSSNLTVEIRPDGDVLPRMERLTDLVRGRSVLHIGCCDHASILEQRLTDGLWLHASLTRAAERCLGIDIDADAVDKVKALTEFDNVIAADVTKPGIADIAASHWDIAVFGDVLEHVPAPVEFLSAFREHYGDSVKKVIVSVPNCMRGGNATGALRSRETINSDHCFEFSPFTLAKVMALAGFHIQEFYYSTFTAARFPKSIIYKRRPYLAHTLIAVSSMMSREEVDRRRAVATGHGKGEWRPVDGRSRGSQPDASDPSDGSLKSLRLLGTPVACATYDSAVARIKALASEARPTAVCPANTHIIGEARNNVAFGRILAQFELVIPDGMPIVWALNLHGAALKDRVYGPYFMRHVLRHTPRPWRHFFFGDSEECLADLRRVLVQLQPDINIVGMVSPPFRPFTKGDEQAFADIINSAEPDFVWVALPGVRMERWIIDNQARYRKGVFVAVGDAFALVSGRRRFAPSWMQRMGLTWAYRLCREPLRLGPRYLRYNSMFLFYLLWDMLRRREEIT